MHQCVFVSGQSTVTQELGGPTYGGWVRAMVGWTYGGGWVRDQWLVKVANGFVKI